ncbi:hypothetical protein BH11BAC2_BH11BAC2_05300 [soil metagenome]
MNQEEHFDDRIRRKLQDAGEESALTWEQVNEGLNDTGRNWLRGFLFSDLLLALLFAGYLLINNPEVIAANNYTYVDQSLNSSSQNPKEIQQNENTKVSSNTEGSPLIKKQHTPHADSSKNNEKNVLTQSNSGRRLQHNINSPTQIHQQNLMRKKKALLTSSQKKKRVTSSIVSDALSTKIFSAAVTNEIALEENRNPALMKLCELKLISLEESQRNEFPQSRIFLDSLPGLSPSTSSGVLPLAIDLYGIVPYDLTQFSASSDSVDIKLNRGSINRNYGYGISFRYPLNEHLFVTGGWQMAKSSYVLNYKFYLERFFWQVDSITGFILSPFDPPVPLTIYDSTEVNEIIKANVPVSIAESKMQLPVTIGYSLVQKNWIFEGSAGLMYTFSQKQSINYSELSTDEKSFIEPLLPIFKTTNRLDATISLSVVRKLSGMFDIFLQTYYQQALGSSTTAESIPDIRHRYTGLKAGVRINFNKK